MTVEPGLYLRDEGIVRLENDVLITEQGPVDLMAASPSNPTRSKLMRG
jgi:Xaa-Pro aminopeptidase